ncbi:MAG: hypothetical protein ACRDRP_22470 [Pseudonocardiaceae bacterium]
MESPSHLRDHPVEVTLTLLATLLYCREREITDTLVELLISTVHRINARADRGGGLALTRSSPERSGCGAVCLGFGGCGVGGTDYVVVWRWLPAPPVTVTVGSPYA